MAATPSDWPAVLLSGFCFFGVFFVLYNIAISYTTAARASLALATLPLHTMVVGALLGIEPLTLRKTHRRRHRRARRDRSAGIGTFDRAAGRMARRIDHDRRRAVHGVLQRLVSSVHPALERARLSRRRHGDGCRGADPGGVVDRQRRGLEKVSRRRNGSPGSISAIAGGALAFILWVLALERATPTRVANTMTVNPVAAGLLATQLVGEPITTNLVLGLVAVFAGIWIATSEIKKSNARKGSGDEVVFLSATD